MTDKTQALLPVTPEPWCIHCGCKEKDHANDGTCPFPPSPKKWTPEGHRWCGHCEQKDPHCSVCEGVGYLPNTDHSALSGDAGEGE